MPPHSPTRVRGTLVLLRHGESTSNAENVFTGWTDVPLTDRGADQARTAADLMRRAGLLPDVVHTSLLRRAITSADLLLDRLDRPWIPVRRSWRLNERHYGALTGRCKQDVRDEVAPATYRNWRRSLHATPPPAVPGTLPPWDDARYSTLPSDAYPLSESLADVAGRLRPYWADAIAEDLRAGHTTLVVAHGNSLRALALLLDRLDEEQVAELNIPTGMPLRYDLDTALHPLTPGGLYLDPATAARESEAVRHQ